MRIIAALLLAASLATAQVVKEVEPNDETGKQELKPGQTLEASFKTKDDIDNFVLVSDRPQVVSVRVTHDKSIRILEFHIKGVMMLPRSSPPHKPGFELRRLRLPKGRFPWKIKPWNRYQAGPYKVEIVPEPDAPNLETEPNDRPRWRHAIAPGQSVTAEKSHPFGDVDLFSLIIEKRGIYRLTVKRKSDVTFSLVLGKKYRYEVDDVDDEFRFFPVLDPGQHHLTVKIRQGEVGGEYELGIERVSVVVPKQTEDAARRAIARGLAALTAMGPRQKKKYSVAAHATALLAIGEGHGVEDRKEATDQLVTYLEERLKPAPDGEWTGQPVLQFSANLYDHAFAVLALAEAAAAGSEHARAVCTKAIPFLLASQISTKRCQAWGPAERNSAQIGGWRYGANARDGDISVTGWCLIALYAAANADIEVPGLVDAADLSLKFLQFCTGLEGYKYQPQVGGKPTSVRQSIGALLGLIFGQRSKALRHAVEDLDWHLCAGTQTGHGDDSPFYYWYYATRVNYLRGGYAWEAWRAVALEQLLRRQEEDGSWAPIRHAKSGGPRYSTGMAVLILRLCIGEPPHYLNRDVEGW